MPGFSAAQFFPYGTLAMTFWIFFSLSILLMAAKISTEPLLAGDRTHPVAYRVDVAMPE